jgi:hypothetical protein
MAKAAWWVGAVLRFVLLPILGLAALTWWLIGDQSTIGSDYIVQVRVLQDHPRRVGAIGIALLALFALDMFWSRPIPIRRYAVAVLPPVLLGGIATGHAGRVITAHVHGANIGGGLAIIYGPIFLLGMIAWASATLTSSIRRASTEVSAAQR